MVWGRAPAAQQLAPSTTAAAQLRTPPSFPQQPTATTAEPAAAPRQLPRRPRGPPLHPPPPRPLPTRKATATPTAPTTSGKAGGCRTATGRSALRRRCGWGSRTWRPRWSTWRGWSPSRRWVWGELGRALSRRAPERVGCLDVDGGGPTNRDGVGLGSGHCACGTSLPVQHHCESSHGSGHAVLRAIAPTMPYTSSQPNQAVCLVCGRWGNRAIRVTNHGMPYGLRQHTNALQHAPAPSANRATQTPRHTRMGLGSSPVVPLPPSAGAAGCPAVGLLRAVLTHAPPTLTPRPCPCPLQVGQQAAQQLASSLLCSQWRYQAALRAAAAAGGLGGAAKGAAAAWGKTAVLEVG